MAWQLFSFTAADSRALLRRTYRPQSAGRSTTIFAPVLCLYWPPRYRLKKRKSATACARRRDDKTNALLAGRKKPGQPPRVGLAAHGVIIGRQRSMLKLILHFARSALISAAISCHHLKRSADIPGCRYLSCISLPLLNAPDDDDDLFYVDCAIFNFTSRYMIIGAFCLRAFLPHH